MISEGLTLEGRRVVVTGSTRGLGEAVARDLALRGAHVVVNGTDAARCNRLAKEIGGVGVAGSVADEATDDRLVDGCCEAFGGIDAVVNNAGVVRDRGFLRMTVDDFDEVVGLHLRGTWLVSQRAARAMDPGGALINVTSGTALYGHAASANYAAAKAGILGLTRALSVELAPRAIRVNAVAPVARTDMVTPLFALEGAQERFGALFGDPADVATVFSFLTSPAADHLTGQVLGFDGRRVTVWSHPEPLRQEDRVDGWSTQQLAETLSSGAVSKLHPDTLSRELTAMLADWAATRR